MKLLRRAVIAFAALVALVVPAAVYAQVLPTQTVRAVATRSTLAALDTSGFSSGNVVILEEGVRFGLFRWDTSDLSSQVTVDAAQCIYVAPRSDTDGSSGAWVRVTDSQLNIKWCGAELDGATDDTTAWNEAIALLNAGYVKNVLHPGGVSVISSATPLTALTADGWSIAGVGPLSEIQRAASGGGTNGNIFTIGEAGNFAIGARISNLQFTFANTPDVDHHVVRVVNGNMVELSNLWFGSGGNGQSNSAAGLLHIERGGNVIAVGWRGGITKGLGAAAHVLLQDVAVITLRDWNFLGVGNAKAANANGKHIHMQVVTDGSVDTVTIDNVHFQAFSVISPSGSTDGKPYGLYMEKPPGQSGSITNVWIVNSVFDHTTTAAVFFTTAASSTGKSRPIYITNSRFDTDSGKGIYFDNNSGAIVNGLDISHNTIMVTNDSAIQIDGDGYFGTKVIGNKIFDDEVATAKNAAISMGSPGWTVDLNSVTGNDGNAPSFAWALDITDADAGDFVLGSSNNFEDVEGGAHYAK